MQSTGNYRVSSTCTIGVNKLLLRQEDYRESFHLQAYSKVIKNQDKHLSQVAKAQ